MPATTDWGSLTFLVPKEGACLRFSVDYRRLNAVMERDSNLILRIDEYINPLGEAQVFPTLDASFGNRKIKMDYKDLT